MQGYDGDPDATAKAVDSEGWLQAGDLAVMREQEIRERGLEAVAGVKTA